MEFKDFQQRVLDTFELYLNELASYRAKADKVIQANAAETDPDLIRPVPDFPRKAWDAMRSQGRLPAFRAKVPFSPRQDGTGRPVPNVCLKIPTGGGKTLLAVGALSKLFGTYLKTNTGFVLWIVPNEAIYTQTHKALTNREHPYRQMLDRTAAGKVKILEKDQRLDRRDMESQLCVMLLMLQAANREIKETLRMFRDRGNVHGFFPAGDDLDSHFEWLGQIPNLDAYGHRDNRGAIIKDSLGNVLRFIRPVVVMDEGHKAYSSKAIETLYGFNPCFVLELSATPKDRPKENIHSNWLVDVRGVDLEREDMIKLPVNVAVKGGDDWRNCLRQSVDQLNELQTAAERLQSESARYIRPIMLVQAERTGKDQREAGCIHSEDVRDYLLQLGFHAEEIAIKTSEINDLSAPENVDLLSPTCPVRVIITKQALQEGWDCPFAYILCSLAAGRNMSAMTQLVGRILRQPDTLKTGVPLLDECYVYCLHVQTKAVIDGIKQGLENDGLGDLAIKLRDNDSDSDGDEGNQGNGNQPRDLPRRTAFHKTEIFLPKVLWVDGATVRDLDYEQDILRHLDWSALSLTGLAESLSPDAHATATQVFRVLVGDGSDGELIKTDGLTTLAETTVFDPVYATRVIGDIVPNPFVARALVGDLLQRLTAKGFDADRLGALSGYILEGLRQHLLGERDRLAETQFLADVNAGRIQFRLRADRNNWHLPNTLQTELPKNAPQLMRHDGKPVEKSLFAPVYQADFNNDEREFACYIDQDEALKWWHRNVAQRGQYALQGWRKHKIYPDFLFALNRVEDRTRLVVLETKGDQLGGNLDTAYKRKLLELLTEAYSDERVIKAGELQLVGDETDVICDLVLMSEWQSKFHNRYSDQ